MYRALPYLPFLSYHRSPVGPALSAVSDISTETASSPITDHSQSGLPEDLRIFETEDDSKESKVLQEQSSSDNQLKELDEYKVEIPKSTSEPIMPR